MLEPINDFLSGKRLSGLIVGLGGKPVLPTDE